MSNMSYCRFQNTLIDLRDCFENMNKEELSGFESRSRTLLFEEIFRFLEENGITLDCEEIEQFSENYNLELQF